ncbi:MAG: DUF3570 domain-containing protein [Chlorobiaceae bacterium]|nr:DUF3570 domain-containing protein [Chlorobiaceae bacterium]NTW11147.1 DUF3570 domain-containing protein [Chlorobiaceae bacterium]
MTTIPTRKKTAIGAALFAAALSLPFSHSAFAEAAPEKSIIAFKYLNYQDWQPDQDRVGVNAYSVSATVPIAGKWSITTGYVYDSVSGASPSYHSVIISGASTHDTRQAVDLGITRYFSKGSITAGVSYSEESDYISRSISLQGSLMTEDKNTTVTLGGSYTSDTINPNNEIVENEKKNTWAGLVGLTQVVSKNDIVQLNFGYSSGEGYYDDPYKWEDFRPRERNSTTFMTRWNHHFDGSDGTSRLSYRYYTDSFGIGSHTLALEYVQPVKGGWTFTPEARYYSQTAADFYIPFDPLNPDFPVHPSLPFGSYDQRLSAFGAITLGIKVEKEIAKDWLVDVKFNYYMQRADWCLTGGGDKGLEPFNFRSIQVGISKKF